MRVAQQVWEEFKGEYVEKAKELDAIDGILAIQQRVERLDREMPSDWTIYMRLCGGPLTAKTDLMLFFSENGIGNIPPARVNGIETDDIVDEKKWYVGSWNRERIRAEMPEVIAEISKGQRVVIFEGVYSSLFHPSGRWWFCREGDMSNLYRMDIEGECVAGWDVKEIRARRRDKSLHKLHSFANIADTWITCFDGRDVVINTNLAEDIEALEKRISGLQLGREQLDYFRRYRDHCVSMKQRYESQK